MLHDEQDLDQVGEKSCFDISRDYKLPGNLNNHCLPILNTKCKFMQFST